MNKSEMYQNFKNNLESEDFEYGTDMHRAMWAYEVYGDATRDNSFDQLVALGIDLEAGINE